MKTNQAILDRLNKIENLLQANQPKPLTLKETAEFLDLSISHLYKLTSAGKIPHYKPQGKRVFFDKVELIAWLKRNPISDENELQEEIEAIVSTYCVNN
mgnify:FL=1